MFTWQRLHPQLNKKDTVMRQSVPTAEYRTIAHCFGIARSAVCEIAHKTPLGIVESLKGTYIKVPPGSQLEGVT